MPRTALPSVEVLQWEPSAIKAEAEARGHGFVALKEAMAQDAVDLGLARNRVLNGWWEVIPIGPTFDEVTVKAADLGKAPAKMRGHGPYRATTFRMLSEQARLALADEQVARSAPGGAPRSTSSAVFAPTSPVAREVVAKIAALVGGTPGGGLRAVLERIEAGGKRVWLEEIPAANFGQAAVAGKWGGGDYAVRVIQGGSLLDEFLFSLPGVPAGGQSSSASGTRGTMSDEDLIKAMKAGDAASPVQMAEALAKQSQATTDALRTGFEIAKGATPATPPLQEFQAVVTSIMEKSAQDHRHLLEAMNTAHVQAMERERARADEFLKLERERSTAREKEVERLAQVERERLEKWTSAEKERTEATLKAMRDADAKVHESLKESIGVQQKSVEREYERMRHDEQVARAHLEEIRRIKAENPDEAALRTLGTVLQQLDHTTGRILDAKYGVRATRSRAALDAPANGTGNGKGHGPARLSAPPEPEKGAAAMAFDLASIKKQVFANEAFRTLLGEAERHVKAKIPPENLGNMLYVMAGEDPSLVVALNFVAGRTIEEVLAEAGVSGQHPALVSPAGQQWFEGLKSHLFKRVQEGEAEGAPEEAPPAKA